MVAAADTTPTSTKVNVTAPAGTQATDFDSFELTLCRASAAAAGAGAGGGAAGAGAANCQAVSCAAANAAACAVVDKLAAGVAYSLTAAAVKGQDKGLPSPPTTFTARYP